MARLPPGSGGSIGRTTCFFAGASVKCILDVPLRWLPLMVSCVLEGIQPAFKCAAVTPEATSDAIARAAVEPF